MSGERCEATHVSPTATGDVTVQCTKERGHDGPHQGRTGPFPIRWD